MSKLGIKSRIAQKGTVIQFPLGARARGKAVKDCAFFDLGAVLITLIERSRCQVESDITIRLSAGPGAGATIAQEEAAALDFALKNKLHQKKQVRSERHNEYEEKT